MLSPIRRPRDWIEASSLYSRLGSREEETMQEVLYVSQPSKYCDLQSEEVKVHHDMQQLQDVQRKVISSVE